MDKLAIIIGVGGGGCNALNYIYSEKKSDDIDYYALNTDIQALENLSIPLQNRLLIGDKLTNGQGAGADPKKGEASAIESKQLVKNFLSKGYKIAFILAGMGGGTGTGAAPIIANACIELDILTISIVSTPFTFEGSLRQKQAKKGIELLSQNSDSVLIFANDNILNYYSTFKFSEAFKYSDFIFKKPIDIIWGIISRPGYINVDFADVETVLKSSGISTITSGMGEGEKRIESALKEILDSPFLSNVNVRNVKNMLVHIESGTDEIRIDEIGIIMDFFTEKFGSDADIIWGNSYNQDIKNKISIGAIITGVIKDQIIEYSDPQEIDIEKNTPRIIEKEVQQIKTEYSGKKIAFLIMQFGRSRFYNQIVDSIKNSLAKYNIVVLRADDKEYHDDLYYNILSYIHASDFGIAIFERIFDDNFNPNVAFEVGYMLGIKKQVCHLKERTLKSLHSDLMGKLYKEFDIQDIDNSLVPCLEKWLEDKEII